ncbi:MAG: DNA polymerase III subunit gamma/tau [Halanaerobiales bacterium]
MAFLSLYRKYRPQNFDDLVGQKHVIRTLKNALENNRIAHAYLFAGPRGTGKTSTAKIYAQALNCVNGPTAEPCGECEACRKIQTGQSIDVIEIDAASNRGIDEIRDLREKVKFYPSEGKYKVYIIDEVHMLTKGAFNALLKTLEEPPENVVFILATTEPHKVIETIHSRCQRFDFTLHSNVDIIERLEYICNEENVKYDQHSLNMIAISSRGGLRDAISLLDQAISFTNGQLKSSEIQEMLGKVKISFLKDFINEVINKNSPEVLEMVNEVINKGKGISIFVSDLIDFLRQVMLYKECGKGSNVVNLTDERISEIDELVDKINTIRLVRFLDILTEVDRQLNFADQPRIILELGVIKMISSEVDNSLEGLGSRLAELEYKMKQIFNNNLRDNLSNNINEDKKKTNKDDKQDYNISKQDDTLNQSGENNDSDDSMSRHKRQQDAKDNRDAEKNPEDSQENKEFTTENRTEVKSEEAIKEDNEKENEINKESGNGLEESDTDPGSVDTISLDDVEKAWPLVLNMVKEENISVQAMLKEGNPAKVEGEVIFIQFPEGKNFHRKGAAKQSGLIQKIVCKVLDINCQIEFVSESEGFTQTKKKISNVINQKSSQSGHTEHKADSKDEGRNSDVVDRVVKAFNGKIIKTNHHILDDKK